MGNSMSNGLKKAGSSRIFRPVSPPSCLAHWSSRSKSPNSCSPFLSFWVSAGNITSLFRCTWVMTAVDPKRLPDFFQDSWMPAAQFFLHMHCATAEQVFLTHQLCVLSWEPVPHLLWCWRLLSCSWMRLSRWCNFRGSCQTSQFYLKLVFFWSWTGWNIPCDQLNLRFEWFGLGRKTLLLGIPCLTVSSGESRTVSFVNSSSFMLRASLTSRGWLLMNSWTWLLGSSIGKCDRSSSSTEVC